MKTQRLKIWSDAKSKRERKKLYASILPMIKQLGIVQGYAIAVHGSMTRDFDIVAIPWRKKVMDPDTFAFFMHRMLCAYPYTIEQIKKRAEKKPHGRIAYDLILGHNGAYVDLSIIPPIR